MENIIIEKKVTKILTSLGFEFDSVKDEFVLDNEHLDGVEYVYDFQAIKKETAIAFFKMSCFDNLEISEVSKNE